MAYRVVTSEPVPAGYQVELVDDDGLKATHTSYHTTAEAAEADALIAWNES